MKNSTPHRQGLKEKLNKKYFFVVVLGILFLLFNLGALYFLKQNTASLIDESIPVTQASEKLQTGLQQSLASLRGWITLKDQRFVRERQEAWNQGIIPSMKKLTALSALYHSVQLKGLDKKLEATLNNLKAWQ